MVGQPKLRGIFRKKNEKIEELISVFPNPISANTDLKISSSIPVLKLELFDLSGKLILFEENRNQLNLSGIRKGFYTLKIDTGSGVLVRKVEVVE